MIGASAKFTWDFKKWKPEKPIAAMRIACGRALYQVSEAKVMGRAKDLCPVDTGALRSSGYVEQPVFNYDPNMVGQRNNTTITVKLKFGNASVTYAAHVHEAVGRTFRVGQAKFLETAILEESPSLCEDVRSVMAGLL